MLILVLPGDEKILNQFEHLSNPFSILFPNFIKLSYPILVLMLCYFLSNSFPISYPISILSPTVVKFDPLM